jgi:hypothetical protein
MIRTILSNGGELFEYPYGEKFYYLDCEYHRENGPAAEYINGDKYWYIKGKLHRTNGPAVIFSNGNKYWYINDERIPCTTQKQFKQLMRLKAFW